MNVLDEMSVEDGCYGESSELAAPGLDAFLL